MSASSQESVAKVSAVVAGFMILVASGVLTVDAVAASRRLPAENARADELIERVRTDAAVAESLHGHWDALRDASLERDQRAQVLAPILVFAGIVFLVSSKRLVALRSSAAGDLGLPKRLCILKVRTPDAAAEVSTEHVSQHVAQEPTLEDCGLSHVAEILVREGRGRSAAVPILQAVQAHYGYLPKPVLHSVCEQTASTPAQLAGLASFYDQFRHAPTGTHVVKVCHGTACHVAGAERITNELYRHLGIAPGDDTDPTRTFTVERVACLGCCTLAPVAQIEDETLGHLRPDTASEALAEYAKSQVNGKRRSRRAGLPGGREHAKGNGRGAAVGEIRIGLGSCCVANGSGRVHDALAEALAADGVNAVVKRVGCVGMCHQTPLIEIQIPGASAARYACAQAEEAQAIIRRHFRPNGLARRMGAAFSNVVDRLRDDTARHVVKDRAIELRDPPVAAFLGRQKHIATEHCGCIDPTDLEEYLRNDGFKALERCLGDMRPEDVVGHVAMSGLRGRGGAGFPTAEKWRKVREAACDSGTAPTGPGRVGLQKYVICNGDEGDPGAFMDRMLMESYPYRVIEGAAIAAYAVGATEGFFYIRREYALATERIRSAIAECERRGMLGDDVLGTGVRLSLRVMEGAGAFVCGEETTLIASIEGRRGMPKLRPPYPAECGLWGRPTLVNNVETFAVVPWILRHGAEAFAALGTESSKGTKVFALAGKVRRGGLIEVPMGLTIREVVEQIGGGVRDGRRFKAVQIGGPSGGCVPAELADTQIDYEALAEVGAIMGSGGLVVLDDRDCMVDIARYFLDFTQGQSCGQCTHCRIGTRRMLEILERLCAGEGRPDDLQRLERLARSVAEGSLCGLGKTAPNPVLTTLRYFRDEYEAHLAGCCPAGQCRALIAYSVTDTCVGCTLCAQRCPVGAIALKPYERHEIDPETCTRCDICRTGCPEEAIEIVSERRETCRVS